MNNSLKPLTQWEIDSFDLEPYGDRLVVKEMVVEQSSGGLFIPDSAQKSEFQTNEGYVIATGTDVVFCNVGDRVYYGRYSGAWIPRMGTEQTYRIMNQDDLLGLVKPAEETN